MKQIVIAIAALLVLAPARAATAGVITSTFDSDADGWTHGPGDPGSTVAWSATGGNPDGCLTLVDAVAGATDYWKAPAKFLGNRLEDYLGTLEYDIKVDSGGSAAFDVDIILTGGGHVLAGRLLVSPTSNYVRETILLQEGPGWTFDGVPGTPTAAQFQSVLADVTELAICGDYVNGPETDSLDNVVPVTDHRARAGGAGAGGGGDAADAAAAVSEKGRLRGASRPVGCRQAVSRPSWPCGDQITGRMPVIRIAGKPYHGHPGRVGNKSRAGCP